jgi:hypothetical protein
VLRSHLSLERRHDPPLTLLLCLALPGPCWPSPPLAPPRRRLPAWTDAAAGADCATSTTRPCNRTTPGTYYGDKSGPRVHDDAKIADVTDDKVKVSGSFTTGGYSKNGGNSHYNRHAEPEQELHHR